MPYAQKMSTSKSALEKEATATQMLDVFGFPTTYDLGRVIDEYWAKEPGTKGQKLPFPGGAVSGILEGCRAAASIPRR